MSRNPISLKYSFKSKAIYIHQVENLLVYGTSIYKPGKLLIQSKLQLILQMPLI